MPVTLVWLLADRPPRRFLIPYSCGLFASSLAIAAVLTANGLLLPLMNQMIWLWRNYSDLNIMPYGSIIGGYGAALGAAKGMDRAVRSLAMVCVALPAVLPVAALAAWSLRMFLRRADRRWVADNAIPYLLACMVAYIGSTYPRADVAHLAFVAVLPATLTAVWIARYAGIFLAQAASGLRDEVAIVTPVGTLRATASDAQAVGALLKAVRPGDGLYAHPYMPLLYFLTQGRNPTRYSYLAPGLMTRNEEIAALDDLNNSPPRWLLHLPLSRAGFLRVFPHAEGLDHRFPMIEAWRLREYVPATPPVIVSGYQLYERPPGSQCRTTGPGTSKASGRLMIHDPRSPADEAAQKSAYSKSDGTW